MTARQLLVQQLVQHEGTGPMKAGRHLPYVDPVGKTTIGYGRNLTDKRISSREAFAMLEADIDNAIHDLMTFPWFPPLDVIRQRALVDMRFNLGPGRFRQFKRMLRSLEAHDFAAGRKNGNGKHSAAEEFLHELQEVRKDTTKIREHGHEHTAQLQSLVGKTDLILRHVERHR